MFPCQLVCGKVWQWEALIEAEAGEAWIFLSLVLPWVASPECLARFMALLHWATLSLVLELTGQPQPLGFSNTLFLLLPPVPGVVEFPVEANL